MAHYIDIKGNRFGKLTAIYICGKSKKRNVLWLCKCDCNKEVVVETYKLLGGRKTSCGCLRGNPTHKMSGTRQFNIWHGMVDRCFNGSNKSYSRYGGRGITVCEKWLTFEGFWDDMKDGYDVSLTIDRIDNDGNYEPENCRWATNEQQANNTSTNIKYTINGKPYTVSQLSRQYNIPVETLRSRIKNGLTPEEAISKRRFKYGEVKILNEGGFNNER